MGKGRTGLVAALEEMRQSLPFPLRGSDSEHGSEFLNAHRVRYCQVQSVQFTRGRPSRGDPPPPLDPGVHITSGLTMPHRATFSSALTRRRARWPQASSRSTGSPAACQPRKPPASETTFV